MSAQSRRNFLKLSGGAFALGSFAGAPAFAQSPPVKIGVLAARSGVLASIGECALATVQWWADGVNKAGGILGRKVELVVEEEGNPKETAERFRKLALRDNVEMVTGLISTGSGVVGPRHDSVLVYAHAKPVSHAPAVSPDSIASSSEPNCVYLPNSSARI